MRWYPSDRHVAGYTTPSLLRPVKPIALRPRLNRRSVQPDPVISILGGHVGEYDLVTRFEALADFDSAH
jgi:hypothetical protein